MILDFGLARIADGAALKNSFRKQVEKMPAQWKTLLNKAFESDQPLKRALVAVAMVRTFPNRSNLAADLAKLFADEQVLPEFRVAGLIALEKLQPKKAEPMVSHLLLAIRKQSGTAKDQLNALF